MPKILPALFFVLGLLLFNKNNYSLAALGIASTYEVDDNEAVDGDILCFNNSEDGGKLIRCQKAYDENMFGVQTTNPSVVLKQTEKGKAIIQQGRAEVNVTTLSGPIKIGDYITSSPISGKGQKAPEMLGYVLGKSLSNFDESAGEIMSFNGKSIRSGKIEVSVTAGPLGVLPRGTFLDKIGFAMVRGTQTPAAAGLFLRYVTAGLLVILVSFFTFNNFGRNISKGMESIGRNPLARNQIQLVIIINTALIAVVVIGTIILSLIIIRL